jgi:uncharacterized DUF497 family protein
MMSDSFEWDETKNKSNFKKHQITFDEAKSCFFDSMHILIADPAHSLQEDRFILIGVSIHSRLLVVVHVEKSENRIRIISARKATKKERVQYEEV